MRSKEELIEIFDEIEERKIFSEKEESAMVMMYSIDYPVQFSDAEMSTEEIVDLKEKNMRLLEEAQSLIPLVQNMLALEPIEATLDPEEDGYV